MICLAPERIAEISECGEIEETEAAHLDICPECRLAIDTACSEDSFIGSLGSAATEEGLRFGVYRQCQILASGAMSIIYLGLDPEGKQVVIKVCRHLDMLPDFKREIEILAMCRDQGIPGVVKLLDSDTHTQPPYLVTEFHPAGSLSARLATVGHLSFSEGVYLGLALAKTLASLKQHGIIHGDLKPANVLITAEGTPCLADLGNARAGRSEEALHDGSPFTLAYMAPEQALSEPATHASDVFSFGILLHEIATGQHPFGKRNGWETVANLINQPPRIAPGLPPKLQELIGRCLAKSGGERPDINEIAASSAAELLSPLEPPAKTPSRRTRLAGLLAAGLVCLVGMALALHRPSVHPVAPPPPPLVSAEKSEWLKNLETGFIDDPALPQHLEAGKITAVYFTDMTSKWSAEFTPQLVAFRQSHSRDFQFVVSTRCDDLKVLLPYLQSRHFDAPCLAIHSPVRDEIIAASGISGEDSPRLVIFTPDGKLISIKGRSIITGRNEVNQIDDKETYQKIWKEMLVTPERKP